jgi:hypothetical protein
MTLLNIVPECYGDTRLVEILLEVQKVNHQKNIGQVANTLRDKLKSQRALAVVDNDKQSIPAYFQKEFSTLNEASGLVLLKHKIHPHFLVRICPALETWLLEAAKEAGISPKEYPICEDLNALRSATKNIELSKNQDFTRFVKALNRSASPRIRHLKSWLQDFVAGKL